MKLTVNEQEYILDMVQHAGWPLLLDVIGRLVDRQEQLVLRTTIEDGNVTRLIHDKLRSEGARKLAADIKNLPKIVKERVKE